MLRCYDCHKQMHKKPSDRNPRSRNGRPWKHVFCNRICYATWRAKRHRKFKRDRHHFFRQIWGTTPLRRAHPKNARAVGRRAEIQARNLILPALGFTEIDDLSAMSNQFFIDFVATFRGKRVLVDATIKMTAHVPEKTALAKALQMPLFILHVSPKNPALYFLQRAAWDRRTMKVPSAFIRKAENQAI